MKIITIQGSEIKDEASFHRIFSNVFGFPELYGHNLNAWIDCMGNLDYPEAELTNIHIPVGEILLIDIQNARLLKEHVPKLWVAFLESVAFVNWRRTEKSLPPLLAISAYA